MLESISKLRLCHPFVVRAVEFVCACVCVCVARRAPLLASSREIANLIHTHTHGGLSLVVTTSLCVRIRVLCECTHFAVGGGRLGPSETLWLVHTSVDLGDFYTWCALVQHCATELRRSSAN